jgi:hypothetical protein
MVPHIIGNFDNWRLQAIRPMPQRRKQKAVLKTMGVKAG